MSKCLYSVTFLSCPLIIYKYCIKVWGVHSAMQVRLDILHTIFIFKRLLFDQILNGFRDHVLLRIYVEFVSSLVQQNSYCLFPEKKDNSHKKI